MKLRGSIRGTVAVLFIGTVATGCATAFTGDAHVPGGAAGCSTVCGSYGMDLAGMVAMGEYSDGCICKVRGQAATSANQAVAGAAPATVGVVMAMRQREEQNQNGMMMMTTPH